MKKVIVVSKTHLDLGFTDLAETVRQKYINDFIPAAVQTAAALNTGDQKRFVWTTGSWILKEALENGTPENRAALRRALQAGDIAPHALPFTLHTELLDPDTLRYGLSLVDELDALRGRKTLAAKMTDVPGHTRALVPLLAEKGIRLLHIGVNGASALPKVPPCFLWQVDGAEVVVIYSGDYGGAYQNDLVEDVLYFDHTLDNHGAGSTAAVEQNLRAIAAKYPGYRVVAGTLDDYAPQIWAVRHRLPVITGEIGDTWIHGSGSDPYKSAGLRTLMGLKNKWLAAGTLQRNSTAYRTLADNLLCLAEHTCGMDIKIGLGEYKQYLRRDFEQARQSAPGYARMERSWAEQRQYLQRALADLPPTLAAEARAALKALRPTGPFASLDRSVEPGTVFAVSNSRLALNAYGGPALLVLDGQPMLAENDRPCLTYTALGQGDYDYWFAHYSRNLQETAVWSVPDFGKPGIGDLPYRQGEFPYRLTALEGKTTENRVTLLATLATEPYCTAELGAPRTVQLRYTLTAHRLLAELVWLDKPANRLPECTRLRFYPAHTPITLYKLGRPIDPAEIVENGGHKVAATAYLTAGDLRLTSRQAPLVSVGAGDILRFDNAPPDPAKGLTFTLHNNIWGTNFPLWYGENAYFAFDFELVK